MAEIFSPPLIQAQSWEEAQRKFNEVLRQMARMMNSIYTGANIPTARIKTGAITAPKTDLSGIDSTSGKIVLSQIESGDLDNIDDGTTYAKVLNTDITAGHILLSECTGSLDNIDDGTSYSKILKTDITAGHVLLSECTGDVDDIDDGTTYAKVLNTDITAGHILLSETTGDLDDIDDGSTYAKVNTTDITAGRINLNYGSGGFKIGLGALGTGLDGLVMNDGTYDVVELGEVSADTYKLIIRDSSGNITVDTGKIMGAVNYQYLSETGAITTTSATYVDMTGLTTGAITFPKCIVLCQSVVWLDTATGGADECSTIFYIDTETVGQDAGAESGKKLMASNMHVQALAAGEHTIKVQWKSDASANQSASAGRRMAIIYWEVQ